MAKTTGPSQADVLLNESAVLLARSQQILHSLLGAPANGAPVETDQALEQEDTEVFKPEPDELTGPGFPLASNGAPLPGMGTNQSLRADEKLRKQMLGKGARRSMAGSKNSGGTRGAPNVHLKAPSKPRPPTTISNVESDEDQGRSSLGKTKRRKTEQSAWAEQDEERLHEGEQALPEVTSAVQTAVAAARPPRKPGSYLDEILAERSRTKGKKKRSRVHGKTRTS